MIKFLDLQAINQRFHTDFASEFERVFDTESLILGESVIDFEAEFGNYCQASHCVGVASGLDALVIILEGYKSLGILKEGDEIIVPANTFIASVLAISKAGLKPILIEPEPSTFNIATIQIGEAITEKTKAVMAVHLYGLLAPMDELKQFTHEHKLLLIEDAAQAHGSVLNEKKAGNWGDAAAFSFYPGKNLGALGDGGAITTNNEELAEVMRKYQNYGAKRKYVHELKGINSRLDSLQAAFLSVKLKSLDADNDRRREIANIYEKGISNPHIEKPKHPVQPDSHVWHLYVIRCKQRDKLKSYLLANGVETLIHYPIPPHKQEAYRELNHLSLPLTEQIHAEVLSLPIYPTLSSSDVNRIVVLLNDFS
jgi:dTDP-4-amino-4,6-dideoxygalactose transaminase